MSISIGAAEIAVVGVPVEFGSRQGAGQGTADFPDLQILLGERDLFVRCFAIGVEDVQITVFAGDIDFLIGDGD